MAAPSAMTRCCVFSNANLTAILGHAMQSGGLVRGLSEPVNQPQHSSSPLCAPMLKQPVQNCCYRVVVPGRGTRRPIGPHWAVGPQETENCFQHFRTTHLSCLQNFVLTLPGLELFHALSQTTSSNPVHLWLASHTSASYRSVCSLQVANLLMTPWIGRETASSKVSDWCWQHLSC